MTPSLLISAELRPTASGLRESRGFTLIETIVALSLLGVAMLLTMSLLLQEPMVVRRLEAHREVLRAMEQILEGFRAGKSVPSGRQQVDLGSISLPESAAAQDLRLWTESVEETASGLFRLTLIARYRVGNQWYDRALETRVWLP